MVLLEMVLKGLIYALFVGGALADVRPYVGMNACIQGKSHFIVTSVVKTSGSHFTLPNIRLFTRGRRTTNAPFVEKISDMHRV